jgi:hypothetical protein
MIFIGLDDTDSADSRGTNQLAKALVRTVLSDYPCLRIVRHQLLFDDRVPYTSKNGSASIWLEAEAGTAADEHIDRLFKSVRTAMLADFIDGSDPGLCIADSVPDEVIAFGLRCREELVTDDEARAVAQRCGLRLEGLGGTCAGVIGALAAVGLAATGDDGRVVHVGTIEDEPGGVQSVATLRALGVWVVERNTDTQLHEGRVDVGKKLRPNLRGGRHVLFVEPSSEPTACDWMAIKLT